MCSADGTLAVSAASAHVKLDGGRTVAVEGFFALAAGWRWTRTAAGMNAGRSTLGKLRGAAGAATCEVGSLVMAAGDGTAAGGGTRDAGGGYCGGG